MLHNKEIDMVVNIPKNLTAGELDNGYKIRRAAIDLNVPLITNARLASAFINAFCTMTVDDIAIKSWEEYKSAWRLNPLLRPFPPYQSLQLGQMAKVPSPC